MDQPSLTIRRRGDGSIDTGHYIDHGNRLHAEAIRHSLTTFGRLTREFVSSIGKPRRPATSHVKAAFLEAPLRDL